MAEAAEMNLEATLKKLRNFVESKVANLGPVELSLAAPHIPMFS
jgi:hypothetical protein